jgi:hypothetical protein
MHLAINNTAVNEENPAATDAANVSLHESKIKSALPGVLQKGEIDTITINIRNN